MPIATKERQRQDYNRRHGRPPERQRTFLLMERHVLLPSSLNPSEVINKYNEQLIDGNFAWVRQVIFRKLSEVWQHLAANNDEAFKACTTDTSRLNLVVKLLRDHIGSTDIQRNPAAARTINFIKQKAEEVVLEIQGILPNENLLGEVDDNDHRYEASILARYLIVQAKDSAANMPQDPAYNEGDIELFLLKNSDY